MMDRATFFAIMGAFPTGVGVVTTLDGELPVHADAIAHAECTVRQKIEARDHVVFLGEVLEGQVPAPGSRPLMYFRRTCGTWPD